MGDNTFEDAFRRFKELADKKKDIYDEDIIALVHDEVFRGNDRIKLVSLQVMCGTEGPQKADVTLDIDGKIKSTSKEGDGPVDAIFQSIKTLCDTEAHLVLFKIDAVTKGTDAQAEVTVRLEEDGKTANGQGADTDTLVAAARAYVHALNKLLVKREKTAPAALTA